MNIAASKDVQSLHTVVVGFSGHRKIADPDFVEKKIEASLQELLDSQNPDTTFVAVSSVAAGSDILFCEVARRLEIPLLIYLPFTQDIFKSDFEGKYSEWWPRAERLIEECKSRGTLAYIGTQYSRDDAYLNCGRACVDHATVLLAVAEAGQPSSKVGAQAMVEYAKRVSKPVISIDPNRNETHQYFPTDTKDAQHPQSRSSISSVFTYEEVPNYRKSDRFILGFGNALAQLLRTPINWINRPLAAFYNLVAKPTQKTKYEESSLPSAGSKSQLTVERLYQCFDKNALDINMFRYSATLILLLEVVGTVFVTVGLIYHPCHAWVLPLAKTLLSAAVLLLIARLLIGHHTSDYRVIAERMRATLTLMHSQSPILSRSPERESHQNSGLRYFLFGLRLTDLWDSGVSQPIDKHQRVAEQYTRYRVDDQISYFEYHAQKARPWIWFFTGFYRLALVLVFLISVTYLASGKWDKEEIPAIETQQNVNVGTENDSDCVSNAPKDHSKELWFYLVPVTLAGLGTFCIAAISIQELGRRTGRFSDASRELKRQRDRLRRSSTASETIEIITELEIYLSEEVYAWRNYSLFVNSH